MTDYGEEQRNELEALESIYPDSFTVLSENPPSFTITVIWLLEPELHFSPFELIHYVFLSLAMKRKLTSIDKFMKKQDMGAANRKSGSTEI